jgi:hypothetical protein
MVGSRDPTPYLDLDGSLLFSKGAGAPVLVESSA